MRSVSIVIPARNEEKYLPRCLEAIAEARAKVPDVAVEVIVVVNRSTDRTEEIARAAGCLIATSEEKNLSKIRNSGAKLATGEVIVTIDADSFMSQDMLVAIRKKLASGKVVGGGVMMFPERWSLGILLTGICLIPLSLYYDGVSGGLFYCARQDFEAIGGFNEAMVSAEDVEFAYRLKQHGRKSGRRFSTIFGAWIVTSCRKFDRFGDWYFVTHPREVLRGLSGKNQQLADEFWYDFKH